MNTVVRLGGLEGQLLILKMWFLEGKKMHFQYLAVMVMKNSDYVPVKEDDIDKSQYTKAKEAIKTAGKGICSRPNFFMKSQSVSGNYSIDYFSGVCILLFFPGSNVLQSSVNGG